MQSCVLKVMPGLMTIRRARRDLNHIFSIRCSTCLCLTLRVISHVAFPLERKNANSRGLHASLRSSLTNAARLSTTSSTLSELHISDEKLMSNTTCQGILQRADDIVATGFLVVHDATPNPSQLYGERVIHHLLKLRKSQSEAALDLSHTMITARDDPLDAQFSSELGESFDHKIAGRKIKAQYPNRAFLSEQAGPRRPVPAVKSVFRRSYILVRNTRRENRTRHSFSRLEMVQRTVKRPYSQAAHISTDVATDEKPSMLTGFRDEQTFSDILKSANERTAKISPNLEGRFRGDTQISIDERDISYKTLELKSIKQGDARSSPEPSSSFQPRYSTVPYEENHSPKCVTSVFKGSGLTSKDIRAPSDFLDRLLESIRTGNEAAFYRLKKKSGRSHSHGKNALPNITAKYLSMFPTTQLGNAMGDLPLTSDFTLTSLLRQHGYLPNHLRNWTWVLLAPNARTMVQRLQSVQNAPLFLLQVILQHQSIDPSSLDIFLLYIFDLLGTSHLCPKSNVKEILTSAKSAGPQFISQSSGLTWSVDLEPNRWTAIITSFLGHARKMWPLGLTSIARMASLYMRMLSDSRTKDGEIIDLQTSKILTDLNNRVIHLLALPITSKTFANAAHCWDSQRIMLENSANFTPNLMIGQDAYRSILSVLLLLRKSDKEEKFARHVARSWPPWRQDQDGMDASRSREEDLSRIIQVLTRMKEAGYSATVHEQSIGILGGREPDGTPTIQSRKFVPRKYFSSTQPREALQPRNNVSNSEGSVWVSRIQATRDIREAWTAFLLSEQHIGSPNLAMYLAMFEKLKAEELRVLRNEASFTPGEGREVVEVYDDGRSDDDKAKFQPPTFSDLYSRLISSGLKPGGRCLAFLLREASNLSFVVQVIKDSDLSQTSKDILLSRVVPADSLSCISKIPDYIFASFIAFLCRQAVRKQSSRSNQQKNAMLLHAAELLRLRRPNHKASWYPLLRALSNPHVSIDVSSFGAYNSLEVPAWHVLRMAYLASQKCGIGVDGTILQFLSVGVEKALQVPDLVSSTGQTRSVESGRRLIKDIWREITQLGEVDKNGTRRMLYIIHGANIHAYVRALGALQNESEEIYNVLEWMAMHRDELEKWAKQTKNGANMNRRILVAARIFLEGGADMDNGEANWAYKAEQLLEAAADKSANPLWTWPADEELEMYLSHASNRDAVN